MCSIAYCDSLGSKENPEVLYTKDGSGRRHFDFSPNNKHVYVSNEMDGTVYSFERNTKTGTLTEIQRISLFPPSTMNDNLSSNSKDNTIKVADIHITPDGKWLYVSERATNTITAFLLMITQVS